MAHRVSLYYFRFIIVHLVRDPRGILNSVQREGRRWSDNHQPPVRLVQRDLELETVGTGRSYTGLQCDLVEQYLELETLGTDRNLRVRYEDLVDKPMEDTKQIFAFMGMTFNEGVIKYIKSHTGTGKNLEHKPGYFNTFRNSDFRHDQWKENLDNREIKFIENICSSVMRSLGYTMLPPN
ncbi:carbohydrate sulfotransferase 1-like [Palaemon carinicauda]|uniref:carbohydrate sulfotransferase 1-like n=1 Tax=Palaemon carinicauda TaxID=392227 RepID=UPI0035B694B0